MNAPELDLIFFLFSSLTIAAVIFLTGCSGKKKTTVIESDYERPPPLQTPRMVNSSSVHSTKNSSKVASAATDSRLPNIEPTQKEEGKIEEKKNEESKNPDDQKMGEEKKSEKKDEIEKKSESKKSEKNEEASPNPESPASKKSKRDEKSKSKVSEKKNEESDEQYCQVNFGPNDLPPPPPPTKA
uniref:Uncharacterized protein n=1 Tax=Panagrolaimus sp. ES5 TaxID=591445 RepID=A0AC34F480_9BILA